MSSLTIRGISYLSLIVIKKILKIKKYTSKISIDLWKTEIRVKKIENILPEYLT